MPPRRTIDMAPPRGRRNVGLSPFRSVAWTVTKRYARRQEIARIAAITHARGAAMTTTFDKREEGVEKQFAHDEELKFKATARRGRLLGLWAAQQLGLSGTAA